MRWQFVLSQVGSGLRRNLAMGVAVVIVTFVSLTFVGAAALLQFQVGKMKGEWYDKVEVAVFMCPAGSAEPACATGAVTDQQLTDVRTALESDALADYVEQVYLETPEQAYQNLREIADSPWLESVTPDQMQYSYRVKLVDPEQYQVIADELTGVAGVERVVDQRETLEPLFNILNRATMLSVGLGLVMVVAAVLLITTTIRLSAMSRQRETSIMRLVGASNMFIQLPFMLEGALAALIGAALAVTGLWAAVHYGVQGWLAEGAPMVSFVTTADVWIVAPFLVLAAILLAGISSLVTLGRYTKV
ncbi:MAG: FtsX-like permease family protein [Actinomycetales bacterium]|jgi:cell division protein FtsX|nr:FtsX-like permease family protein [Actinomycetales bacterium]